MGGKREGARDGEVLIDRLRRVRAVLLCVCVFVLYGPADVLFPMRDVGSTAVLPCCSAAEQQVEPTCQSANATLVMYVRRIKAKRRGVI